jgi:hypothetical protein
MSQVVSLIVKLLDMHEHKYSVFMCDKGEDGEMQPEIF